LLLPFFLDIINFCDEANKNYDIIIIIIIIIINNGVAIFSFEYFLIIFGTHLIFFKSMEEVWYAEYLMKVLLR
jgi:hypothetical protein